jgi:hypothetical protein
MYRFLSLSRQLDNHEEVSAAESNITGIFETMDVIQTDVQCFVKDMIRSLDGITINACTSKSFKERITLKLRN